jgi:hypothetical protein
MLFDGQVARIEGDIHFDGALLTAENESWWIDGRAQLLQLELSQQVRLDENQSTAQASRLTLSDNVDLHAFQRLSDGSKKSHQEIQLPTLSFDIQSNEIMGVGPGSIRSWYLSDRQLGKLASALTPNSLQGAHLTFRESLRGFLKRSEVYFQGKVELATGPLTSWDHAIDLASMSSLLTDQMLLRCDLLKVYDTADLSSTTLTGSHAGGSKTWEFQAKGNVSYEGKANSGDFEGTGSEVTYSQSKELLYIYGEAKRPASIQRTPLKPSSENVLDISFEYLAINPQTLAIEGFKPGQNGIRLDFPGETNGGETTAPNSVPFGPAINPRESVRDYFQRRQP